MVRLRMGALAWVAVAGLLAGQGCSGAAGPAGSVPAALATLQADAGADGGASGAAASTAATAATAPHAAHATPGGSQAPAAPGPAAAATVAPPDRVMVTLAPAPQPIWDQITLELERTYRLHTVFAWSMQSLGERCIVFEAPADRPLEGLLRRLASDPRVELAQRVQRFTTQDSHAISLQVPLQHSAQALRLAQAHRWATGKGVRVAVIDTGVDVEHPELRGRIAKPGTSSISAAAAIPASPATSTAPR
jgi:hypothetical protein